MAAVQDPGPRDPIKPGTVSARDFPAGLSWLNTEIPLSIRQLRGKVVLLDFWTYCCINCMHVVDDLKRLERKYRDELVVIGVHSAKFDAEKDTDRIRQAVLRHGIEHPVVNDRDMVVWQSYAVRAWPSLLLIDPRGKVFGAHSGEQVYDLFDRVIAQMIEHYDSIGELRRGPVETALETRLVPNSVLSFPGKVLADGEGDRLFIADTNHHRIVVASLDDGSVLDVIGSGTPGLVDGAAGQARFLRPQGMARSGGLVVRRRHGKPRDSGGGFVGRLGDDDCRRRPAGHRMDRVSGSARRSAAQFAVGPRTRARRVVRCHGREPPDLRHRS